MSFILVQVRNYTQVDNKYDAWASQMTPNRARVMSTPPDFPYLALYMQLGDQVRKKVILEKQLTRKR